MLSDALRYPTNSDGWVRTILIGGLLTVLSVLILPWFVLQGYYVRVLHGVTGDDAVPPRFEGWGDLLVDGLKLFVLNILVTIVFLGVQVAAAALADAGSFLSAPPTGPAGPGSAPSALGIFGLFYVQVVTYYLFGRGFAEGLDTGGNAEAVTY